MQPQNRVMGKEHTVLNGSTDPAILKLAHEIRGDLETRVGCMTWQAAEWFVRQHTPEGEHAQVEYIAYNEDSKLFQAMAIISLEYPDDFQRFMDALPEVMQEYMAQF